MRIDSPQEPYSHIQNSANKADSGTKALALEAHSPPVNASVTPKYGRHQATAGDTGDGKNPHYANEGIATPEVNSPRAQASASISNPSEVRANQKKVIAKLYGELDKALIGDGDLDTSKLNTDLQNVTNELNLVLRRSVKIGSKEKEKADQQLSVKITDENKFVRTMYSAAKWDVQK